MDEKFIKVYVKKIEQLTAMIKGFELAPVNALILPGFSAGSHIITRIPQQDGSIERRYSLTNSPNKTTSYSIAVRKQEDSKGGSLVWHEQIKVGDSLEISYPKNHFLLSNRAKYISFLQWGSALLPFFQ